MKISKFDKTNLKEVRDLINDALQAVLTKHGLTANIGSISYSDADFTCKLTVSCGSSDDAERREFEKYAPLFNLKANEYGSIFTVDGKSYELVALKPRSSKYPIIGMNDKGQRYKFSQGVLK